MSASAPLVTGPHRPATPGYGGAPWCEVCHRRDVAALFTTPLLATIRVAGAERPILVDACMEHAQQLLDSPDRQLELMERMIDDPNVPRHVRRALKSYQRRVKHG